MILNGGAMVISIVMLPICLDQVLDLTHGSLFGDDNFKQLGGSSHMCVMS